MYKKFVLAMALALTVGLVGCGGGGEEAPATEDAETAVEAVVDAAEGEATE